MAMSPQDVEKMKLDLWTAKDMVFNGPDGQFKIPKYTKCYKVPYTKQIKWYLEGMEKKLKGRHEQDRGKAVAVYLKGMIRYVWRVDVLTKKEFDATKSTGFSAARVLRKKRKRSMGQDDS